jgi:N-acylneuraminate cytidylyltransferase
MYKDFKVLAVIPARGGSKGIPKKNIKPILGKPLLAWSISAAQASRYIDRTIVSTDSEEIAEVARRWGAEAPFLRPPQFARDDTPDLPVFAHCLAWLEEQEGYEPDLIAHLRPTGPLRTGREIDEAIELLVSHPEADSVRSVQQPSKPPFKMWRPQGDYIVPFAALGGIKDSHTMPRQLLPVVYETTADIGVCRTKTILEKKSVIGDVVLPYLLKRPTADIDQEIDFEIAEFLLGKRQSA